MSTYESDLPIPATTFSTPRRILIIEDDADIAQLIQLHLSDEYGLIATATDGLSGYQMASSQEWDLIVLDLRLPGKDGLSICKDLRAQQDYVPILMLTSKSSELDRVLGLELGADDYVTKPFSIRELSARIKAILRRASNAQKPLGQQQILHSKQHGLCLNLRLHSCHKYADSIDLTAKEFELMAFFMRSPGSVFSRTQLLNDVWGYGHEGYEHTVNSHINRLRAKIEDTPTEPAIITTVWGVGYKLHQSE